MYNTILVTPCETARMWMSQNLINKKSTLVNTLRPRQNGRHFPDIFKWIFLNENIWIWINISLKFVPRGPINNIPTLVQVMAWRRPGDKPLSEPMMVRLPTHICVTRPQWVKTMAWCHQATAHVDPGLCHHMVSLGHKESMFYIYQILYYSYIYQYWAGWYLALLLLDNRSHIHNFIMSCSNLILQCTMYIDNLVSFVTHRELTHCSLVTPHAIIVLW